MNTRHRFLAGAAATAAASLCGCAMMKDLARRSLRGCPGPQLPPLPIASVTRTQRTLQSRFVAEPVKVITLSQGAPRRVAFALGGRPGDAEPLADMLQPYFSGFKTDAAIACVDGGETYWHKRAAGEDRLSMLFTDALPHVRNAFPHVSRFDIIGWSMGGFGALVAAQTHPELFDRVCAVSPALWHTRAQAVDDAFDSDADFARFNAFAHVDRLRGKTMRVTCGTADPFYHAVLDFVAALERQGIKPQTNYPKGGCHDGISFAATALDDLRFLIGT